MLVDDLEIVFCCRIRDSISCTYPKGDFLELVHCPELFESAQHSVIEWRIGRFSVLLDPRVICRDRGEIIFSSLEARSKIVLQMKKPKNLHLLRTWKAVSLWLGSVFNIFRTRSLAPGEIAGHGSLVKSMCPLNIALKIPVSFSVSRKHC